MHHDVFHMAFATKTCVWYMGTAEKLPLMIVESGKKAGIIKWLLDGAYDVMACGGHVRDLPASKLGIDLRSFALEFVDIKKERIAQIVKRAKGVKLVLLATDPDREGEAIAWHLHEILKKHYPKTTFRRITSNEITRRGFEEALENQRDVDIDLVHAQHARRAIDRLVGYKLGDYLKYVVQRPDKKKYRVTSGRVQCAVLQMLNLREGDTTRAPSTGAQSAPLYQLRLAGKAVQLCDENGDVLGPMDAATAKRVVQSVAKNPQFKRARPVLSEYAEELPPKPYNTSSMQQDAYYKLGFGSQKTMSVAQQLYERGVITYMRTDAAWMSSTGIQKMKEVIERADPSQFVARPGNKFGAHECIRPIMGAQKAAKVEKSPKAAAKAKAGAKKADKAETAAAKPPKVTETAKLEKLITSRAVASQMKSAIVERKWAIFSNGAGLHVRYDGCKVVEENYLTVYDDRRKFMKGCGTEFFAGAAFTAEKPEAVEVVSDRYFTEAGLIKHMESEGIGRPSTYVSTLARIMAKGMARNGPVTETRKLSVITASGKTVQREEQVDHSRVISLQDYGRDVLAAIFKMYTPLTSAEFTSQMESALDLVAEGRKRYEDVMKAFWAVFGKLHRAALASRETV